MPAPRSPSRAHPLRGAFVPLVLFLACLLAGKQPGAGQPSGVVPGGGDGLVPVAVDCPAFDDLTLPVPLGTSIAPSAGTLPGSFSVSAGGQANYSFPLVVPPGRLGMEPRLAVAYDSGAGQGTLGVGFSLQGLSVVTRCPANLAQDGYIAPVFYDDRDHFCLDGLRLVPVPTSAGAAPGTVEYRTFPDTFSKVWMTFGATGPVSFEVFTKAGHVLEYGAAPNSQAMATGGTVAAWWLTTERDRRGNAVDYTYENDVDPGDGHTREMLPSRIDYTRNGSAAASRAVLFTYQDTTPSTLYGGGLELTQSKLIQSIEMVLEPAGTPVRFYGFEYGVGPGTQRPVLTSVEECAGIAGPCKPATTFAWSGHAAGFTPKITPVMVPAAQRDVLHNARFGSWVLADVNGDGLDDIVLSLQSTTNLAEDDWWVSLDAGGSFAPPTLWGTFPHPHSDSNATYDGVFEENWTLTPLDVDQDGRIDIFLDTPDPSASSWPHYRWLQALPNHTVRAPRHRRRPAPRHLVRRRRRRRRLPRGGLHPSLCPPRRRQRRRHRRSHPVLQPDVARGGVRPPGGIPNWTVNLWVPDVPGVGGSGLRPDGDPDPGHPRSPRLHQRAQVRVRRRGIDERGPARRSSCRNRPRPRPTSASASTAAAWQAPPDQPAGAARRRARHPLPRRQRRRPHGRGLATGVGTQSRPRGTTRCARLPVRNRSKAGRTTSPSSPSTTAKSSSNPRGPSPSRSSRSPGTP